MLFNTLLVIVLSLSGVLSQSNGTSVSVSPSGEIVEGSSVTLTCSSDANPPVQSYTWFKIYRGVSSETGGPEDSYTIKHITLHDAGEYICQAVNAFGTKRSPPKRLDVLYSLKHTSLSVSPSGEIVEGSSVILTCSSDANPPVQNYTWFKNNRAVSSWRGTGRSYTITKITLQDAGEYYCAADNAIGQRRQFTKSQDSPKYVSVSVSSSGKIVEGRSVTLTCSSDANPPVQRYTWFKKIGSALSVRATGRSYTIKKITLQDAGAYYCQAENAIGTNISPRKRLNVQYSPKYVSVSVSPSGKIVEGRSVTLTCSSDANPPEQSYTWYKKIGSALSVRATGRSYTIKNITLQDAGEYYCQADNAIGTNRSPPKHLDVQYSPKYVSVSVSPSGEIVEGSSVTLNCSSYANPPVQRYTWFKNNRAVSSETGGPEDSYTIKHITLQDAGEYYCEAENAIGTNRSPPKRLDMQYLPKSISVSVSPSGEIVEGSSVTLTCSSDANPPVQNYAWIMKNDTGVWQAGSGQSVHVSNFRSWNSGQYYCESQNRHGAQNASALLVTVQGGQSLIAAAAVGVAAILALVFLGVLCVRRRKSTNETEGGRQGGRDGDTYASLQLHNLSPEYDVLQKDTVTAQEENDDYENPEDGNRPDSGAN